ncbi:hypothetical protein TNCV_704021 [Trichonephila clavipes]|nr:hypothetical protein TNCV_704021 [Trichonephila clavipes]
MLEPPDGDMTNRTMTGDSPHIGTGIVLYQIQHSHFTVWRFYSSFNFVCVPDEGFAVRQTLRKRAKKTCLAVAFWSNVRYTNAVRIIHCNQWPRMPDAYQRTQRSCNVSFSDHFLSQAK